ncbi:hypothetical protein LPJ61_001235 [Coemansia biformis]|uniref:Uncharacterized protein n=1 Tax=Coemansia biformis TaxID=1286918 RepID=A0A9W8CXH4_9FUNG|nr:hypothetical protein LPJ61_001235 [Coemansia biformis]
MDAILEWATHFYCAADDHEMLADLLPLRARAAGAEPAPAEAEAAAGNLAGDRQPLHLAFYRLRKAAAELGPSYLGLDETEEMLDSRQPWASPLNLQRMAKRAHTAGVDTRSHSGAAATGDAQDASPLEPFSSPFSSPPRAAQPRAVRSADRAAAKALDVPAMVHMLITVEGARRHFAAEFLSRRNAQGSVAEQSERWQHHFAKRNIAAETKFENILIALKELVVLRAVVDHGVTRIGELKQVLGHMDAEQHPEPLTAPRVAVQRDFDAAQCLAVLNLMFPLDLLGMDTHCSASTGRWQQRYARPLQHVPSPRMQLHQLLCEVEAWVSGDERVTVSVGSALLHSDSSSGDGDNVDGATTDEHRAKRARTDRAHTPANCPTWLAAARGLAWGQLKQSCITYLRDAQQKITDHYQAIHPWATGPGAIGSAPVTVPEHLGELGDEGLRIARAIQGENGHLLEEVMRQVSCGTPVLERIARHSRLIKLRFSPYAAYDALARLGASS